MIRYSRFVEGRRDNAAAIPVTEPWADFARWVSTPVSTDDKHRSGYSPLAAIRPGHRGRIVAGPAGFVAFEYDDSATWSAFAIAAALEVDGLVYTTASANRLRPRFRVVLRPSRPIDAGEYASVVRLAASPIPAEVAPESYQITRLWYRPITRGAMAPLVTPTVGGGPVDVDRALQVFPPAPPRPPGPERTDDELAAWPLDLRIRQAWDALDRRRPAGAYAASCVCHDYGVPQYIAAILVLGHGQRIGWTDLDADAIADRVAHAYDYARDPFGHALIATVESHPDLRTRIARLTGMEVGR